MSREKHSQMRSMYYKLPTASIDSGDFVNVHWLSSWLRDEVKLGPLDNIPLLCSHSKLNPEKYKEYKLISSQIVSQSHSQSYSNSVMMKDLSCLNFLG